MTREQFIEQVLILVAAELKHGPGALQTALDRADKAWSLLHPAPQAPASAPNPTPPAVEVSDDERVFTLIRDQGPILAVGGDMPLRARDVLIQKLRRRDGRGMQTGRLYKALSRLTKAELIWFSPDHREIYATSLGLERYPL